MHMNNSSRRALGRHPCVGPCQYSRIQGIPNWRGNYQVNPQTRICDHHFIENVVGIANPGDYESGQPLQRGRVGCAQFDKGLQVGENLRGVVQ